MLSKILTAESRHTAAHWSFPAADGSSAPLHTHSGSPAPAAGEAEEMSRRIAGLERQLERQAREAREAGLREGEAAGRAQASAELRPVLEELGRTIAGIAGLRPRLMREAQADLVELSLGIARRVLHRELSIDPAALEALVKAALDKMASLEITRIRVHPELEAGVHTALAQAGRGGLSLVADPALARGSLLIETTRGRLDASLDTQLAEIGRGLADRIPEP